ncbi:hypothetical protein KQX54_006542 [Cotesia glomerata]|uniref:Uncharacterized protein n=1 Tax=Cotesia glomerata TaxID=32391 RepID=A0AAV7IYZ6_COTGL|nr:hypothetical protein KQX54_006542 [Cotesia glomerata]
MASRKCNYNNDQNQGLLKDFDQFKADYEVNRERGAELMMQLMQKKSFTEDGMLTFIIDPNLAKTLDVSQSSVPSQGNKMMDPQYHSTPKKRKTGEDDQTTSQKKPHLLCSMNNIICVYNDKPDEEIPNLEDQPPGKNHDEN